MTEPDRCGGVDKITQLQITITKTEVSITTNQSCVPFLPFLISFIYCRSAGPAGKGSGPRP